MNQNNKIENYLEQVKMPVFESEAHRKGLRQKVVELSKGRDKMGRIARIRKLTLIAAVLILTLAAAAGAAVVINNIYFIGEDTEGAFVFQRAPEEVGVTRTFRVGAEEVEEKGVDQVKAELEELDRLRKQKKGELVGVREEWVNGNFSRELYFEYVLSSGKRETLNEPDWDSFSKFAEQADLDEIMELKARGKGKITGYIEFEVGDTKKSAVYYDFTLGDGRHVMWSPLRKHEAFESIATQKEEFLHLELKGKVEFLGTFDRVVDGREVILDAYQGILSDGTVITKYHGSEVSGKCQLTLKNIKELEKLRDAGVGENLGVEEKIVKGKKFKFNKNRYMLSDGTELITAKGVLVE